MLRNSIFLILFCFLQLKGTSQEISKPELIAEVEGLAHCESVAYDAQRNNLYVSVMAGQEKGDGSIAIVSPEGKIKNADFVKDLDNPKGIAIHGTKLYVSDVTFLYEIDINSGKVLNKFTGYNSKSLNDVAIDEKGQVYVSDMGTSSIYRLDEKGNFEIWHTSPNLETPNGLLIIKNNLYIAGWRSSETANSEEPKGRFLKLNMDTKKLKKITPKELGNLDGIQKYDQNNFLVSDWGTGNIYKISQNGKSQVVLKTEKSAGDLLYIPEQQLLAIPMNFQNKVLLYSY